MSNIEPGWRGKRVKHADGRTGVISRDYSGFCHVSVTIQVDGSEDVEHIQLNSDGQDSGALGWSWCCTPPDREREQWALLGDHNGREPANG